jgi:hypothetical protein
MKGFAMKKILFGLIMTALVSLSFGAQSWTAPTTYPYAVIAQYEKSADSITGIDSVTLLKAKLIDNASTYAFYHNDSTGTADSMIYQIQVYNAAGTMIYASGFDTTVAGAVKRWSPLPINKTVAGTYLTVQARSIVATVKRRIRNCAIIQVAPITPYKKSEIR